MPEIDSSYATAPGAKAKIGKAINATDTIKVTPLVDFFLNCPPAFVKQLEKGKAIDVPKQLLAGLKTEGVVAK